jgi:hypothetical protein
MSRTDEQPVPVADGTSFYTVVSLSAAFATALPLLARDLGIGRFFPALVGCIAVAARWRSGLFYFMATLVLVFVADRMRVNPLSLLSYLVTLVATLYSNRRLVGLRPDYESPRFQSTEPVLDILLCAAVLMFIASYLRLISLTRNILPVDRRRRWFVNLDRLLDRTRAQTGEHARSSGLVERVEVAPLLIVTMACVFVGELVWLWLRERNALMDLSFVVPVYHEGIERTLTEPVSIRMHNGIWQLIVLLWLLLLILVPVAGVLGYLGLSRASLSEAALFLQDAVWRQTRREQARDARWLAWAEQRHQRRLDLRERREARRKRRGG